MEPITYSMERREVKFFLTEAQYERLLPVLEQYMQPDAHGTYEVQNIYYDTDDYAIVRAGLSDPVFKEKFRIRSYGIPEPDTVVFAELKKKFRGVTYKRRLDLPLTAVPAFVSGAFFPEQNAPCIAQTAREIRWFLERSRPGPRVFIGYDREPYEGVTEPHLRVTFDRNIRWRTDRPDLKEGDGGAPLLNPGWIAMEVKTPDTIPLWLVRFLSAERIYRTGFSKYGVCYEQYILPTIMQTERNRVSC